MIDKNNNITLIFILLFVILVVYYYDKHYKCKIENLKNKIEQFKDINLEQVENNVEAEVKKMTDMETKFKLIFQDNNKDKKFWAKIEDGKIQDISNKKKTEKGSNNQELWKEQTISSVLDTDKLVKTNNNIHNELKKMDYSNIKKNITNYVQNERISNLDSEISKLKSIGKDQLNPSINTIKNAYNNKTLWIKKLNNNSFEKQITNHINYNNGTDYYHIRIDDPSMYEDYQKKKESIKNLGGQFINNSWKLKYDSKKYKEDKDYKKNIDKKMKDIEGLIADIQIIKNKKSKCLSFDNKNKKEPYLLESCHETEKPRQLMTLHNIKLEDGCYDMVEKKFKNEITNTECVKNLNQELRPNKDKYLCNYNQHANYPYTINENEIEFLPNTFSIIKPFNFTEPQQTTQQTTKQQNTPQRTISNNYLQAFEYMGTSDNQMLYDNEKTETDTEYEKKCITNYNFPKKKKHIESCLTIDKEGISFQDCNLRKNQRWLPSEKKSYC